MFRFKSFALISKVLFEINSFARVEKTNSCSNTSKNAARLYFYKEQFLSYSFSGVGLSAFPSVPPPFFEVGKWCKGKCYFLNHQIFSKDFSEFFQNLFSHRFRRSVSFEAGAKVSQISESPKDFGTFFSKFLRTVFFRPGAVFFSRSGCKDKGFSG